MTYTVPRHWVGQPCFILAGGASLRGFDASVLRGRARVIAINDSWRMAPWADALYFCDAIWWRRQMDLNRRTLDDFDSFHGVMYNGFWVSGSPAFVGDPQVRAMTLTGQLGLETDPRGLRHGSNSGYQAINLAYHYGAQRIALLGYDMRGGHWHDEPRPDSFDAVARNAMLPCFPSLAEALKGTGVEVVNATPGSALDVFPRRDLADLLADPRWVAPVPFPGCLLPRSEGAEEEAAR